MGIYIQSFAKRSAQLSSDPQAQLVASARRWAQQQGLEDLFFACASEEQPVEVQLCIYTSADAITFNIDAERVDFGTKTSSAGPGYHAAIIDLCDHFGRELGLQWRWDVGGDETGYAVSRDRAVLEDVFLEQLRGFADFWDQSDASLAYVMNLVIGLGGDTPGTVSTPLGLYDLAVLAATAEADDEELRALAPTLYPWWYDTHTALFWAQTLRAMLWTEAVWRSPDTPWETHIHAAAAALAAKIASRQETCPTDLRQALQQLQQSIAADHPVPGHIGYRRRLITVQLTGYWSIQVPGHYREALENEGETVCLWDDHESIRSSSWRLAGKAGSDWPGSLKGHTEAVTSTHAFRLPTTAQPAEEGWRIVFGECVARSVAGEEHLLIVSITSELQEAALLQRLRALLHEVVFQPPAPLSQPDADA